MAGSAERTTAVVDPLKKALAALIRQGASEEDLEAYTQEYEAEHGADFSDVEAGGSTGAPQRRSGDLLKTAALSALAPVMGPLPMMATKTGRGILREGAQGATLGWADEGEAALRGALTPEKTGDALQSIRGERQAFKGEHPGLALGTEVLGGLSPIGIGMNALKGAKTTGQALKSLGKVGATTGLVAGSGSAEGGLAERATGGAIGAAAGGALAPATVMAPVLAQKAVQGAMKSPGLAWEMAKVGGRFATGRPPSAGNVLSILGRLPEGAPEATPFLRGSQPPLPGPSASEDITEMLGLRRLSAPPGPLPKSTANPSPLSEGFIARRNEKLGINVPGAEPAPLPPQSIMARPENQGLPPESDLESALAETLLRLKSTGKAGSLGGKEPPGPLMINEVRTPTSTTRTSTGTPEQHLAHAQGISARAKKVAETGQPADDMGSDAESSALMKALRKTLGISGKIGINNERGSIGTSGGLSWFERGKADAAAGMRPRFGDVSKYKPHWKNRDNPSAPTKEEYLERARQYKEGFDAAKQEKGGLLGNERGMIGGRGKPSTANLQSMADKAGIRVRAEGMESGRTRLASDPEIVVEAIPDAEIREMLRNANRVIVDRHMNPGRYVAPDVLAQVDNVIADAKLLESEVLARKSRSAFRVSNEKGMIGPLYHGSPHKFDKFDSSKIGTGEGAQAYGHGLYLTESEDIAKKYRADLSQRGPNKEFAPGTLDGKPYSSLDDTDRLAMNWLSSWKGDAAGAAKAARDANLRPDLLNVLDDVAAGRRKVSINRGALYKAELPDAEDADFLLWDKPLSEQPEKVKTAVSTALAQRGLSPEQIASYTARDPTGESLHATLSDMAGKDKGAFLLKDAGLKGIKYLDGMSRGTGEGSHNYVIFPGHEGDIRITGREGKISPTLKMLLGTGAASGGTLTAALALREVAKKRKVSGSRP